MAIYSVTDVTLAQESRLMSSGPLRSVLLTDSRARIWRDSY